MDTAVRGDNLGVEEPMVMGGFRLFTWLNRRLKAGPQGQVFAEQSARHAVISGRRTYDHAVTLARRQS